MERKWSAKIKFKKKQINTGDRNIVSWYSQHIFGRGNNDKFLLQIRPLAIKFVMDRGEKSNVAGIHN